MDDQGPDDPTIAVLGADEANLELLHRMPGHERQTFVPVRAGCCSMTFARDGWSTRTVTRTVLTCTPAAFEVHGHLDAYEGEHRTFSRDWERSIPRDLL